MIIEIQYIDDCPLYLELIERVQSAVQRVSTDVELKVLLVDDLDMAREVGFRGSPTFLLNAVDYWDGDVPFEPMFACRYLPGGLPSVSEIQERIEGS